MIIYVEFLGNLSIFIIVLDVQLKKTRFNFGNTFFYRKKKTISLTYTGILKYFLQL